MKVVSTTKVGRLLREWGFVDKAFTARDLTGGGGPTNVDDETYGKKSFLYVTCRSKARGVELWQKLCEEGVSFRDQYSPGTTTVEIRVSYFRGHHWDE